MNTEITTSTTSHLTRGLCWILASALTTAPITPAVAQVALPATVDMNLGPSTTKDEPSNVMLDLSVEFPTVGAAYREDTYNPAKKYVGYWDPKACYKYHDTTADAPLAGNYFYRTTKVDASGNCNLNGASGEYSGNLLNFAASSAIDILRLALTGGAREIDTPDTTILSRAYLYKDWKLNDGYFPNRKIPSKLLGKQMPAKPASVTVGDYVYGGGCQNYVWFGDSNSSGACAGPATYTVKFGGYFGKADGTYASGDRNNYIVATDSWERWDWSASNIQTSDPNWCSTNFTSPMAKPGDNRDPAKDYFTSCNLVTNPPQSGLPQYMYARVRVCEAADATARKSNDDDLCLQYPSGNYKPIGQVQQKADQAKIGVFGYTSDSSGAGDSGNGDSAAKRYGGVLRAPLALIGPTVTSSSGVTTTNADAEWNSTTGVYIAKPRTSANGTASYTGAPKNGAINYLNGFGTLDPSNLGSYKTYDSFGGMYLESLRYFAGNTAPDSDAINSADSYADNFPYYTVWKDPIDNACQRSNYILAIGDVNTWDQSSIKDKTIAGATLETWLARVKSFESGSSSTFTGAAPDSIPVDTAGNPNTRTIGGSGRTLTRQMMAGAAYAAHTQPIRTDSKNNQSLSGLRVNTFAIDVDEEGNGTLDSSLRSIKPRDSSLYLMGKYGWFSNTTKYQSGTYNGKADNHPFTTTNANASPYDNAKWEDPGSPNTPDGYVIASQADRMVAGIKKFFNAINPQRSTVYGSALSNNAFNANSPSAGLYVPLFDPSRWTGTLQRFAFSFNLLKDGDGNVTGSTLQKGALEWDAGKILTESSLLTTATTGPQIKPADRKIFTLTPSGTPSAGTGSGQAFTAANWSNLSTDLQSALMQDWSVTTTSGTPPVAQPTTRDATYAKRVINYLRGDRSTEQQLNSTDANRTMRTRTSVMGDVINSAPVYKQGANPELSGEGYDVFATTQKTRTAAVYVGANDGMLHAFKADKDTDGGKELFAYIPAAVAANLNRLPNPAYAHIPYVDGQLTVDEAQITTTADGTTSQTWKTLLVGTMGGGAQGIYALDVTAPASFGADNVLFEFTDAIDPDIGNISGAPSLVKIRTVDSEGANPTFKWYVAVSSGFNNFIEDGSGKFSSTGEQALYLLSVDKKPGDAWVKNTNWFKMKVGASSGLSNPGVGKGLYGDAQMFYAGDTNGRLWKFDLQTGLRIGTQPSAVKQSGGLPVPLAITRASSSGTDVQPITSVPQVSPTPRGGYMVTFGTGKFMESGDIPTTGEQGIYGVWDNLDSSNASYNVDRSMLLKRTVDATTGRVSGDSTFVFGSDTGTYRGWYVKLISNGERIITEGAPGLGDVTFSSLQPDGGCGATGAGRMYQLNTQYGSGEATQPTNSYLGRPNVVYTDENPTENTYGARTATGRRRVSIGAVPVAVSSDGELRTGRNKAVTIAATGRVGWREIKNFK